MYCSLKSMYHAPGLILNLNSDIIFHLLSDLSRSFIIVQIAHVSYQLLISVIMIYTMYSPDTLPEMRSKLHNKQ